VPGCGELVLVEVFDALPIAKRRVCVVVSAPADDKRLLVPLLSGISASHEEGLWKSVAVRYDPTGVARPWMLAGTFTEQQQQCEVRCLLSSVAMPAPAQNSRQNAC
jgi:hypothetical protein